MVILYLDHLGAIILVRDKNRSLKGNFCTTPIEEGMFKVENRPSAKTTTLSFDYGISLADCAMISQNSALVSIIIPMAVFALRSGEKCRQNRVKCEDR